jgi:hypothetical protein
MKYNCTKNCLNVSWTKLTIITVVTGGITMLIFNPRILLQYRISKYIIRPPKNSQNSMTHYLRDDIHVALVCARKPFNEMAISTIKSIMFHHRKLYSITFHIFTDSNGEKMIRNYFNSIANFCTKFKYIK